MRDGQEPTGIDEPTQVVARPRSAGDLFRPRRTTPHRAGVPAERPAAAEVPVQHVTSTEWWDDEPAQDQDWRDWFAGPLPAAGQAVAQPLAPPTPRPPTDPAARTAYGPAGTETGGTAYEGVGARSWLGAAPVVAPAEGPPEGPPGGGPPEGPPDEVGPAPRRRMSNLRKALIGVAGLLVILVAGGALGVHLVTNRVLGDVQRIPDVFGPLDQETRPEKPAGTEKTLNFLLVGVDTRAPEQTTGSAGDGEVFVPGRQRSDVIMVVHVAADRKAASVISIPRDSWVTIPGRGKNKINAAYSLGGGSLLVQTVESLTGLRIDHFAVVDFAGFKGITDSVGGIDVRVAAATGDKRGQFPAGVNHLDGDQALVYVRQRYNLPGGDLDRVRRQQNVIKALMTKAGNMGLLSNPARTLGLADSVAQAVSVDDSLSNGDLRSLVLSLRHLRAPSVKFLTAPVSGLGREGKASVVRLDTARSAQLWTAVGDDDVAGYVRTHPDDVLGANPR